MPAARLAEEMEAAVCAIMQREISALVWQYAASCMAAMVAGLGKGGQGDDDSAAKE